MTTWPSDRRPSRRAVLAGGLAGGLAAALPPRLVHATGNDGWPRRIPHETGELLLSAPPRRILSTAPSLTGVLLAIGAPLVASAAAAVGRLTDDSGFFRQWAKVAHDRGVEVLYPNLAFDIEALIVQAPDLVIASATGGDSVLPYLPLIEEQGLPVMVLDYSSHGWEELAETLGRASGQDEGTQRVIRDFADRATRVGAGLTRPPGQVSIVSYNLAGTYAVGKPSSPQAKVAAALGFDVVGLPDALQGAVTRSADFDFISHENLPAAITGDSVFLMSGSAESVQAFCADPVLANLPAVAKGQVYPMGPSSFRIDYYSGLEMIETLRPYFTR